jgi:hypothetical protein
MGRRRAPKPERVSAGDVKMSYEFLTEEEAAEELRLPNKRKLQQLRRTGKGPPYRRHGSLAVYTLEDLRAWSEKQRFENTTQERL